jgi:hypothetical protein
MKVSEQGRVELGNGNVHREVWKGVCFRAEVRDGADQNRVQVSEFSIRKQYLHRKQ